MTVRRRAARAAGPALVAAAFAGLAAWSWGRWPDPLVDFGRELYLPWQVSEGRAPWSDLAVVTGPLSVTVNALWFRLFGASLATLALCNMALLAVLTALLHGVLRGLCGRAGAAACTLAFLAVFGFSQYTGIGNYNYVCPYTHLQTHGLLLCVAALALLTRALDRGGAGAALAAGLCLGGVLLTRMELSVAAAAAAALAFALARRPGTARLAAVFLGAAGAVVAAAFVLLRSRLPPGEALAALGGDWAHFGARARGPFYLAVAGLDRPAASLLTLARATGGLVALLAAAAAADLAAVRRGLRSPWDLLPAAAAGALLLFRPGLLAWEELGRPLPLAAAAATAAFTALALRPPSQRRARAARAAVWSAFALTLLGKMLLNAQVRGYGFTLAMPAALVLLACLLHAVPRALRRRHGGGRVFRSAMAALAAAAVVHHLRVSDAVYRHKTFTLGSGANALRTFPPVGEALAAAVAELGRRAPAGATLAVWPEGALVNFLTRRANPLRQTDLLPGDLAAAGGEEAVLRGLAARPPDFIALVHRETREFGVGYFGADPRYGRLLMDWVRPRYRQVWLWGAPPLTDGRAGIALLERRPGTGAGPRPVAPK